MTEIFLLLWLADAVGSLQVMAVFASILSVLWVLGAAIVTERPAVFRTVHIGWLVASVAILILPSASAIRLLAVGEVGALAAGTQLGGKALQAAEAVLDDIISKKKAK